MDLRSVSRNRCSRDQGCEIGKMERAALATETLGLRDGNLAAPWISLSLLRNCSLDDVKNSARNAWTNIGVTTSLVMTTVVGALIEGHEISPQGLCMDPGAL